MGFDPGAPISGVRCVTAELRDRPAREERGNNNGRVQHMSCVFGRGGDFEGTIRWLGAPYPSPRHDATAGVALGRLGLIPELLVVEDPHHPNGRDVHATSSFCQPEEPATHTRLPPQVVRDEWRRAAHKRAYRGSPCTSAHVHRHTSSHVHIRNTTRTDMPLASRRETGSSKQSAPYQRPLSNTRPPHHQNSVGTCCVQRVAQ